MKKIYIVTMLTLILVIMGGCGEKHSTEREEVEKHSIERKKAEKHSAEWKEAEKLIDKGEYIEAAKVLQEIGPENMDYENVGKKKEEIYDKVKRKASSDVCETIKALGCSNGYDKLNTYKDLLYKDTIEINDILYYLQKRNNDNTFSSSLLTDEAENLEDILKMLCTQDEMISSQTQSFGPNHYYLEDCKIKALNMDGGIRTICDGDYVGDQFVVYANWIITNSAEGLISIDMYTGSRELLVSDENIEGHFLLSDGKIFYLSFNHTSVTNGTYFIGVYDLCNRESTQYRIEDAYYDDNFSYRPEGIVANTDSYLVMITTENMLICSKGEGRVTVENKLLFTNNGARNPLRKYYFYNGKLYTNLEKWDNLHYASYEETIVVYDFESLLSPWNFYEQMDMYKDSDISYWNLLELVGVCTIDNKDYMVFVRETTISVWVSEILLISPEYLNDGTLSEKTIVTENTLIDEIFLIDDSVYYTVEKDDTIYKIGLDGTNWQVFK